MQLDSISEVSFESLLRLEATAESSVKEAKGFKYQFCKGSNAGPGWEVTNGAILMTET